jgi:hypothetical protein
MLIELMLLAKLLGETPDASKGLVQCATPTSQRWQEVRDHRRNPCVCGRIEEVD